MSFVVSSSAWANAELRVGNVFAVPGGTALVPVRLISDTNVVAAQFDLVFASTNLTDGDATGGPALADHQVTSGTPQTGIRRVIIHSPTNAIFGNGTLAYIPLTFSTNTPYDSLSLRLTNIVLANAAGLVVTNYSSVPGTLTCTSAIPLVPVMVMNPASLNLPVGAHAEFETIAFGKDPLGYQWYFNHGRIAGATNAFFALMSVDIGHIGDYTVVITNASGSVTSAVATLAIPIRVLSTAVNGSGQIQVSPTVANYYLGQTFTLTATPGRYYAFAQWNDGVTTNPRPIIINSNNVYTANFTNIVLLDTYTNNGLTIQLPVGTPLILVNDRYSPSNSFAIPETNAITVTLQTGFTNGYLFYTLDGSVPIPGENAIAYSVQGSPGIPFTITNSTIVTAVAYSSDETGNVQVDADPVTITVLPVYALTNTTPGGGSVTFDPPGGAYISNTLVTATATASNGWTFLGWSCMNNGTNNPLSFALNNSTNLTAVFGTLITNTATSLAGASVALWPPVGPYAYGSTVRLVAVPPPNTNRPFSRWFSSLIGPTNNPYNLVVTNAYPPANAHFGANTANFFITTLLNGYGTVTRTPSANSYASNTTVALTAVPDAGNVFVSWTGDASGSANPVNVLLNANKLVTAVFAGAVPPTIISQPQNLTVNPDSNAVFTVSVTNGPPASYQWFHNGTNVSGATSATLNIASAQKADGGNYFVIVTNLIGGVTSSVAVLTVADVNNQPPTVAITNPISGAVFSSPVNLTLNATASDADGTIAQVAFYAGTNLLAVLTNAPFSFTWTNATVGTNLLTAVVTDNLGAVATSAVVSVTVNLPPPGPAVFTLGAGAYSVQENGGSITVTIQKNFNSVASVVNYNSSPGSAVPHENGLGNYDSAAGSLSFTNGELSKTVTIQVHSTAYYVGNRTFYFSLAESGDGGTLGSPSLATITIVDLDTPASTNSYPQHLSSGAPPAHTGSLRVTLVPTNAAGQWRLVRETVWRNSGDTAINLAQGNYEVEFKTTPGFVPPSNTTNSIVAGQLNSVTNIYGVAFDAPQFGSLTLTLTPAAAVTAGAQWRILGDSVWRNSGYTYTNILASRATAEFKLASGWVTPGLLAVTVSPEQNNSVTVNYPAPDVPFGVAPAPLPYGELSSPVVTKPYQWNGELLSDSGYGSGFVVKPRVVLTAAHVVFNDATLSYVGNVRWFFQRYAGQYEPPTQTPRGWYVFDGYAAARTNDNSPGVSSPASQNLDVAALYFYENAGRGGYGGYLVSDGGTEWLQLPGEKTLMGYPVEGVDDTTRGQLYYTSPLSSITFTGVTNRVFKTTGLYGYPGMSGGPLCVQYTNSQFFPAAVYLGGSGQAIVRAIDGAVADLINKAETTANTGNDFTGGGVISLTSGAGGLFATGNFQITLNPPEAIAAGAGWRVTALTNNPGTYYSDGTATYGIAAANYTLTFHAATGYLTPANRSLAVVANQTAALTVTYTNIAPQSLPVGLSNGVVQLAFSGAVGQRYAIERSTNLTTWATLVTNTVGPNGVLRVNDSNLTNQLQRAFYRARFVP